jgi:hypothetical protein
VKVKTLCRAGCVIIAQAKAKFRGIKISLTMSMKSKMVKKTMLLRFWTKINLKNLRVKLSWQRNSWSNYYRMLTNYLQNSKLNCSIF